jgi:hypothetical protein
MAITKCLEPSPKKVTLHYYNMNFRHFAFYLSTLSHVITYFHINILHIFILPFIKIIVLIAFNLNVIFPFASYFSHHVHFNNLFSFVCCMHSGPFLFAFVV